MTKPILQEDKVKLLEGFEYLFQVLDLVRLQDQNEYFLLADPNGMKHFLEASPYYSYNIPNPGKINCTVSKINCTGRIFLEPSHPFLKTGYYYRFRILNFQVCNEKTELNIEFENGSIIKSICRSSSDVELKENIFANGKVVSFKKGIPEIEIIQIIY
jgi:hypothetical protein